MRYRYLICAFVLWASVGFTACEEKTAVKAGKLNLENGSFSLYIYDDAADRGDSSIAMSQQTVRNEKGENATVWRFNGKVTTKYTYGYTGVVILPDDKNLALLQNSAEKIKLRVSGDNREYRLSVDTENVKDGNTFGRTITFPKRYEDIVIPIASLKQDSGWGTAVPFKQELIKNLKIQTVGQPVSSFSFTIHSVAIE
ncbi:MAG: CIA30 family protein [Spirochaetaceae bacterium]|jgi:hypothetical protein|nr:CIA30 family protein [Spirochaetaceae bacterium]